MYQFLSLAWFFVSSYATTLFYESTNTLSGWISSDCTGISSDDGDYACGPWTKCILMGGCSGSNASYLYRTWSVSADYDKWKIKFSVGTSIFRRPDSVNVQYSCGNMTNYCSIFHVTTECNRNLGCLNVVYNLPSICDNVDSISIKIDTVHGEIIHLAFVKAIALYYNETDGMTITEQCYLDPTSVTPTKTPTEVPTSDDIYSTSVTPTKTQTKSTNDAILDTRDTTTADAEALCVNHSGCNGSGVDEYCCPNIDGTMLDCCTVSNIANMP
eukprot:804671_1